MGMVGSSGGAQNISNRKEPCSFIYLYVGSWCVFGLSGKLPDNITGHISDISYLCHCPGLGHLCVMCVSVFIFCPGSFGLTSRQVKL